MWAARLCVLQEYTIIKIVVGHHANGEAAKHPLVSVTEAYQTVLQESKLPDPILQTRRSEITNQIATVHSRARAVEKMGQQIEAEVEEAYKKVMRELKDIIGSKLTVLLGDELELKRQLKEIERLESFLKYQQSGDATNYLFNWTRHQQLRAELHDFRFFKNDLDVELDAKLVGQISVVVDRDQANLKQSRGMAGMAGVKTSPIKPIKTQIDGSVSRMGRIQMKTSDFFAETLSFDHGYDSELVSESGHYRS